MPNMNRLVVATFSSPLFVSLFFGRFAFFAYLFLLSVTAIFAVPLFFYLKKIKRLQWWHAVLSGLLVCMPVLLLPTTHGVDDFLHRNNVLTVGIGTITALIFWWVAVFRNSEYSFVSYSMPVGQIILLPIFVFGVYFHNYLDEIQGIHQGRVLSVQKINPYPIPSNRCMAEVLLSNGKEVMSDFTGCNWPMKEIQKTCFHLHSRWSLLRFKVVYSISNRCGQSPPVLNDSW